MITGAAAAAVLEPGRIGPVVLRNRVFVAPHTTNFGVAGENLITDRHLSYHQARARGGAGLIITEGIRVHPTSLRKLGLHAYDDEALPGFRALADTVHAEGAALFAQLLHTGRHSGDDHYGSWGATATPWTTGATVPHVMNSFDIEVVIAGFMAAAERVVAAGFDGMEVHLGHGHLLQQFLSPLTNDRTDRYGASARSLLSREIVAAVVDAVAGRAAVGVRLSADEFQAGGLTPDDVVAVVAEIRAETPLDFLHVSHSAYVGAPSLSTQMADMSYGRAPFRHLPARFKAEFPDIPVLAICRIDTLETGAEMLEKGEADFVGFARAHIAEPNLTLRSVTAGPAPRSCIACNQGCNANLEQVTPITCTVNPAVGVESAFDRLEAAPAAPRTVFVVGAGPAGLEAAITAARRGHRVQLHDAGAVAGGTLLEVIKMNGRDGFGSLAAELIAELADSSVEVHLGEAVTADIVVAAAPDEVVLATGARPDPATRLDLGQIPVLDTVAVLDDLALAGERCVIIDDLGTWEASGLALQLAAAGVSVDLVSSGPGFAARVTVYSRLALGERLGQAGVRVHALRRVVADPTDPAVVRLEATIGGDPIVRAVDSVVHVRPPAASSALFDELAASDWNGQVHLVGDVFAPRSAQEAIYEGRVVGLAIGVDDPAALRGVRARPPYVFQKSPSVMEKGVAE